MTAPLFPKKHSKAVKTSRGGAPAVVQDLEMRIGRIQYVNSIPFFYQLENAVLREIDAIEDVGTSVKLEYFQSYPSRLNRALRSGRLHIAPVSSLEYLNHQKDYYILPDVCIGSRDFSGSVILFSKEKIEGLNKQTIAVSNHSLSSINLLKVILKLKYKFENRFVTCAVDPEETIKKFPAMLMIGDDALFYKPKEFLYKYDLSELWWDWTEKPFCFSLWVVRRDFADTFLNEIRLFHDALVKNRDENLADIELLIKESLGVTFMDERFPKIFGYLFNMHYQLDPAMLEGLELFYRLASRIGVSPKLLPLEFVKLS